LAPFRRAAPGEVTAARASGNLLMLSSRQRGNLMHRPVFGCAALALVLSTPALAKSPSNDEKEMQRFTLTSAFLDKMLAVQERIATFAQDHPEMEKQGKAAERQHRGQRDDSIDGTVKKIESFPPLVDIIKAQGLTVRQYVLGTMALLQAAMYAALKMQMPDMKTPEGMNMPNVAFIEAHKAELDKFRQRMNAAAGNKKPKSNPLEQEEKKDDDQ
jgi:hypothetical protein